MKFAGPAQIEIGTGPGAITITKAMQLNDLNFTAQRKTFALMSQASEGASGKVRTGYEAMLKISIADITLQLIAAAFGVAVITDATTATKKKVVVKDDAGCQSPSQLVVVKPYDCEGVMVNANEWLTLPNAQVISSDPFSMVYGLKTQRGFEITVEAFPDTNGVRFIFGDTTATPAL